MITKKLYDIDSHLSEFEAKVIKVEGNSAVLDKTAFFPEGGGQLCDTGIIGNANVTDVQIINDEIIHITDVPLKLGEKYNCQIDWNKRFARMQNHSGEHIVSGIIHKLYGYDNVGFHMGDEVTVDFNGELSNKQLTEIELLANEAVYKNVKIIAEYPDKKTLSALEYRSKLELTDNVRIVTIEGYDKCACCAPHVSQSGEIGMIKILSSMRHRGGTRITMLCGSDALRDSVIKYDNLAQIAVKLSAKQNEAAEVFEKFCDENTELKIKLAKLRKDLIKLKSESVSPVGKNIILFEDGMNMPDLRTLVLDSAKNCSGFCAGFSGNDNDGYIYAIASFNIKLREKSKSINSVLCGKGGGSDELIQGSLKSTKSQIENFLHSEVMQ